MKTAHRKQERKKAAEKVAPPPPAPTVTNSRPAADRQRHALIVLALWGITLLSYANSFQAGLVFDNSQVILQDSRLTAATPENVGLIFSKEYWYPDGGNGLYRPLTTLSYLFNYAVLGNGRNPAGYHWINYALHAANASLVYLLGLVLFGELAPAFAMAAIWAVHPILTESVTNVVGRADLLAGLSVLAGLLCYLRAMGGTNRRRPARLAGVALATAIGMFSKESAIVVLAAVIIYEFTFGSAAPLQARIQGYLAMVLPAAIFLLVRYAVLSRGPTIHFPFADNPLVGADFWTSGLTAIKVLGKQLWLLVWPVHLSPDYSYNQIPLFAWRLNTWEAWKVPVSAAVCLAAAAVAVLCYRRNKPVFFCIAFFFAALVPTSNLVIKIGTIMAERFLYTPSIGFAGCLVAAAYAIERRLPAAGLPGEWRHRAAAAVLSAIAVAYGLRTYARNLDWRDEKSLWASAVAACPSSYKTRMADARGDYDAAIREMEQSLAILRPLRDDQSALSPYINAGQLFREKGDSLLAKGPDRMPVPTPQSNYWHQRSLEALLHAKRIEEVYNQEYRRADLAAGKPIQPRSRFQLYQELGRTYMRLSDFPKAVDALESALKQRMAPDIFEQLSVAYFRMHDSHQAAIALLEDLVIDPGNTKVAAEATDLYRQIDPQGCALETSGRSTNLNLGCPLVRGDFCTASRKVMEIFHQAGRQSDADRIQRGAASGFGCR